ncbi:serine hydrolase domain-containing protein [Flagellimonas meridianipacifica]|uniref:CubicO group peptidase (Beta-lactamase class C family) n=1 Tax=Flagellimonas meridianipacifica TaxID=1080225 RepID=A0A2T0MHB9_9FLAO|nr:serine hydrolase domain-containing protein [Allomuricauda pacifica]PRX56955.1 CubicO group peptidase (beta-lactamase class C family) [Allomuricauda pacifica]
MRKQLLYLFILLVSFLCGCTQQDKTAQIEELMGELYNQGKFNGAIMVSENNELVYSKGFGFADFEKKIPFQTYTSMDAGSMAKTFTALGIYILEQRDVLSTNDRVANHIDSFPYDGITIEHLLNHTSGLVSEDFVFNQAEEGNVIDNDFFLKVITDSVPSLLSEPGSKFQYNGINYILLAIIIEKLTGNSYNQFIKAKIADSLQITDWFLRPARLEDWPKDRTKGYKKVNDSLQPSDLEDYEGFYGDCNLFFSASDLLKWSQSFYANTIIDSTRLNELLKTKSSISGLNALHWYVLEDENQFHFTGHWKGFYTMVYFDTNRKRSIVYVSNTSIEYGLRPQLVTQLLSILNNTPGQLTQPNPINPAKENINSASYNVEKIGVVHFTESDGQLNIAIGANTYNMYEVGENYFYVPSIDLWIWFSNTTEEGFTINCSDIYGIKRTHQ